MKLSRNVLASLLLVTGVCGANIALAGPPVTITFKNLSTTSVATYSILGTNETITNANSSPKPAATVAKGGSDTYVVSNTSPSPDLSFAYVRYGIGARTCVFYTSFLATSSATGVKTPHWSKNITYNDGATCNATITSTNIGNNSWAVEFTMK
jgi:hypothetical protein